MKRRQFVKKIGTGAALAGGAAVSLPLLSGCNDTQSQAPEPAATTTTQTQPTRRTIEWRMVTTWPKGFPGLGTGAEHLARLVEELTDGQIRVRVFGAGEIAAPFDILDTVSEGTAEMGHGAAYYWQDQLEGASFFGAVPFGFNGQEMNAWLYYGGGMELWQELYAQRGLVPTAGGNTGVQLGGWFTRRIDSIADIDGLRMRLPGFAQEVMRRHGGIPTNLPGGELFSALRSGELDATEWVGPYNDVNFGLHKAAPYMYYPGWQEPGTCIECFVNAEALNSLSSHLRRAVLYACRLANYDMLAEFTALNADALQQIRREPDVEVLAFPDDVMRAFKQTSTEIIAEQADKGELTRRIHRSFTEFFDKVSDWHAISEAAMFDARRL
ncbi:TRAP-type mannitol/chloroaromatic compound transport system substrate-binding protein [Natronocella acetinitrilica]|uniref:TRAP-type mannitol/chloroaromatic compound transport system substrate-binding protein n=1 Tax=Natronocella acetinitrilica TaxID=414046 RepID=A0AAE3G5V7_9GAMM|nr:ABC transporter substrate-binding protein [Natronocella acetinitrilica]MCP1675962.1 TRAP-type mannitol/chloroaromatic compound transport system substrate-binding protein [Natronocella acetinitrilica]